MKIFLGQESNLGNFTYKANALTLSYQGRQPFGIFSLRKPVWQTHPDYHEGCSTEYDTRKGFTIKRWEKDCNY